MYYRPQISEPQSMIGRTFESKSLINVLTGTHGIVVNERKRKLKNFLAFNAAFSDILYIEKIFEKLIPTQEKLD